VADDVARVVGIATNAEAVAAASRAPQTATQL